MRIGTVLSKDSFALPFIALITLIIGLNCGDNELELIARPWVNTEYRDLPDSILRVKAENNDSLAAMVIGWKFMLREDTVSAANYLTVFNQNPPGASAPLNYLTGLALLGAKRDSLATEYFLPLINNDEYPHATYYLASIYRKLKNDERALEIYQKMDPELWEGVDDSVLVCKAALGDTASAIEFAQKMLEEDKIVKAAPILTKYVSMERGKSPAHWNYLTGMAYYRGNNPTRAAAYLENADADTSFKDLSYHLGLAYYKIKAFDSAASKLDQAMELGDSSINLFKILIESREIEGDTAGAFERSLLGIELYPEVEDFYVFPSKLYYKNGDLEELLALVEEGRKQAPNSYKLDAYYTAVNFLLGNDSLADALVDTLVIKHRYYPGALSQSADLFEQSLGKEGIAEKLRAEDPMNRFPNTGDFLFWYHLYKEKDKADTARVMLENWIENDTVTERLQLMKDLYVRDFPEFANKKSDDKIE
ncbi:MAG: tetratricopeptide repeat protein [candidate division Zixibacteria bacterium]|nr:tetratricopeptide repeat protein [candidate division Zixibacteria bacterium]NIR67719.1 tetratricopeptide repeat protein [candidate division Zixibacteria bacterium]NIS16785.1 tetratricopeptide repeat protein [candidate division Zixibacteria bacterium]NIS48972.1 tetratricopeptide repeat protein [candidate division Zixibacteria bacterium]NIT53188.1 tetratricopeptide repeat protein [candidate division Zixibacteria bacterium]